jgi:hypothetical protein
VHCSECAAKILHSVVVERGSGVCADAKNLALLGHDNKSTSVFPRCEPMP